MKTEFIKTALMVKEVGSFYVAAEFLFMSPNNVYRQVTTLENELGFSLFERVPGTNAPIETTKQGAKWLELAKWVVGVLDHWTVEIKNSELRR